MTPQTYPIDRDVPIPRKVYRLIQWDQMQVGERLLLTVCRGTVHTMITRRRHVSDHRYVRRTMPNGLVRLWRVK